jgi:DNA repair exonuclease SbcCD ATPase subunit
MDQYSSAVKEWQGRQGQVKLLETVISKELCVCLRPIDHEVIAKIRIEIAKIQSDQPREPEPIGVTDWTLRSWTSDDRFSGLVTRLEKVVKGMREAAEDRARAEVERARLEAAIDHGALSQIQTLEAQRAKLEADRKTASKEKDRAIELLTEAQKELETAERAAGGKKAGEDVGTISELARAYASLFKDVLDDAIPWYRERLQIKVQEIFRKLSQKDPDAIVEFDPRSSVPRIRLPSEGQKVALQSQLSEGEKMRLGLAFLIGLREVASERPFLMLDAPFSDLDDAGIRAVLQILQDLDSQVIIFTKNRLKPDEFQLVSSMNPTVLRMDWVGHIGKATKGHTTVRKASLAILEASEAA